MKRGDQLKADLHLAKIVFEIKEHENSPNSLFEQSMWGI